MTLTSTPPASNYNTEEIWRKDRDHFLHPWTHFDSFKKDGSLVITEGTGAYVTDARGKRYLDGIGSLWSMGIGYARNEMADAIAEQVRRLPFFNTFVDTTNPPAKASRPNRAARRVTSRRDRPSGRFDRSLLASIPVDRPRTSSNEPNAAPVSTRSQFRSAGIAGLR